MPMTPTRVKSPVKPETEIAGAAKVHAQFEPHGTRRNNVHVFSQQRTLLRSRVNKTRGDEQRDKANAQHTCGRARSCTIIPLQKRHHAREFT
jgi:hypothetical protein